MKKNQRCLYIGIALILLASLSPPAIYALEAVASIKNLTGSVDIERNQDIISARTGLILHDKDLVVTDDNSRVTIIFRDGSVIRLFPNTRFLIEKSEEASDGSRRFLNNFKLRLGSFWGKFTKARQITVIETPTATCGIKGTTVAFAERDGALTVSLSTGLVSIKNSDETIDLTAGKMVQGVGKTGMISDKIQDLPYRITIIPDHNKIELPAAGKENEIYFTLQLVDISTNKNVNQSGNVYISLQAEKVSFDPHISLNSRGYARVKATVKPFEKKDFETNGKIEIIAIMDGEKHINVGAGRTTLTYDIPSRSMKVLKIDAGSGSVK